MINTKGFLISEKTKTHNEQRALRNSACRDIQGEDISSDGFRRIVAGRVNRRL